MLESYRQLAQDDSAGAEQVGLSPQRVSEFYRASGNREAFARYQALYRQDFDKG